MHAQTGWQPAPPAVRPSRQLATRRLRQRARPWAPYSQSVCIDASALNKEPLMTPSRCDLLLTLMTAWPARGFLQTEEAKRHAAL